MGGNNSYSSPYVSDNAGRSGNQQQTSGLGGPYKSAG